MELRIRYHQFMQGFYTSMFLMQSSTNKDIIMNAGKLERICQRILLHTQALINLTANKREANEKYTEKQDLLQKMIDKYKVMGAAAKWL